MSLASTSARTIRSLQAHRNYRLYFAGQTVSISGTWVQNVAQAWLIVQLSHTAAGAALAIGGLYVVSYLPYTAFGLFGGPLVDRFDKRTTIVVTQSGLMLCAAALAGLALTGDAQLWEVYLLAAVSGTVQVVDTPARQAFVFDMVGREDLPNAVSLNSSLFNLARAVGPAVGGALIATVGVAMCFAINAASFLAVIACLLLMRTGELYRGQAPAPQGILRSAMEGVRWTLRTPAALIACGLMLVVATFGLNFSVILPIMATSTLHSGAVVFGVLSACFGGGALLGALFVATVGRASWAILLGGGTAFSILLLVLAPIGWVVGCATVLVVTGFSWTLYGSMSNATVQLAAPDGMRGRAMGVYSYVMNGVPVGAALAGWLCAAGGTQLALLVAGGVSLAAVGVAWTAARATVLRPRMSGSVPGAPAPALQPAARTVRA
jgi:MFS family permease